MTSTPTRPVENLVLTTKVVEVSSVFWLGQLTVLTTKGLQERNTTVGWDDGGKLGKILN